MLCSALLVAGCGSHTGVVKINDNHYMISKQDIWAHSGGSVKADLYKEAAEFCAKQGKQVQPFSSQSSDALVYQSSASAEVQFSCK